MKALIAILTAAVVVIAAVAVYAVFIRDPEASDARDYFEHYLDTCDEAAADRESYSPSQQLSMPPDFDCDSTVDELMDRWEDEARPDPSEIAEHPSPAVP